MQGYIDKLRSEGFHILKNLFRHRKVRYWGLAKNGHQLHTLFELANVLIGARQATT
jgi:IS5 family transposase